MYKRQGLKARVDAPHYNGGKKHIHVYYKGKEYSQNDNGSTSQDVYKRQTYTYHFDNLGRCTDVHDQDGNANTYQYFTASANTDSDADMQKHNSLLGTGSTQKNILNFVDNPGFENVGDNWIAQRMSGDPNYEYGVCLLYTSRCV